MTNKELQREAAALGLYAATNSNPPRVRFFVGLEPRGYLEGGQDEPTIKRNEVNAFVDGLLGRGECRRERQDVTAPPGAISSAQAKLDKIASILRD